MVIVKEPHYTHKGLAFGFVPVYLSIDKGGLGGGMIARGDISWFFLENTLPVFEFFCFIAKLINPDFEIEGFPVTITGKFDV